MNSDIENAINKRNNLKYELQKLEETINELILKKSNINNELKWLNFQLNNYDKQQKQIK